ncbi:MAG: hypothetical protein ACOYVF_01820 [Candidatus Zixiibacteriota bacterium]
MPRILKSLKRTLIYAFLGGIAGFILNFAYINLGSTRQIMCNPYLAVTLGVVFGAVLSLGD